jgi:hypothetical protein
MAPQHLYSSDKEPEVCPACGAGTVAYILYGHPSDEAWEAEEAGELVLGGCCVSEDDPCWQCTSCGVQIYPEGAALEEDCGY